MQSTMNTIERLTLSNSFLCWCSMSLWPAGKISLGMEPSFLPPPQPPPHQQRFLLSSPEIARTVTLHALLTRSFLQKYPIICCIYKHILRQIHFNGVSIKVWFGFVDECVARKKGVSDAISFQVLSGDFLKMALVRPSKIIFSKSAFYNPKRDWILPSSCSLGPNQGCNIHSNMLQGQ